MTYIILALIYAIAFHERDEIIAKKETIISSLFKPFSSLHYWYMTNIWQTKSWWLKNVFTMFLDGNHFWASVQRLITLYALSLLYVELNSLDSYLVYLLTILAYLISGLLHSILNGSFFRKGLKL